MPKRSAKRIKTKRVRYPVEGPLHVVIDKSTGTLVIESPVLGDVQQGTDSFILSLEFSALATDGFIRVLSEMENEIGSTVAGPALPIRAH